MSSFAKNVLIGTTLEEGSDEIVWTAFGLARANGATVHLVHVMPRSYAGEHGVPQKLFDRLMEQAYRMGIEGIYFSLRVEAGVPCAVLETLAREVEADLIVIGAYEPGLPRLQGLGSTADRLLRGSTRPVFVVRGAGLEHLVASCNAGQILRESATSILVVPPGAELFETMDDLSSMAA
jgi:nucleotide-binding universal stress UspA family protein